jgi:hypothetical protein
MGARPLIGKAASNDAAEPGDAAADEGAGAVVVGGGSGALVDAVAVGIVAAVGIDVDPVKPDE